MATSHRRGRARLGAGWVLLLAGMAWAVVRSAGAAESVPSSNARFNPRDFTGIWENAPDQIRTFDPNTSYATEQPPLKPLWRAEWDKTRARQRAGMKVWDPDIACLPPGMPRTMNMSYPFEIIMSPRRVTLLTEYYNETRRIFLGSVHPSTDDLEPTFRGHSIGHWEGNTLVIDTVGIRYETVVDLDMVPHSDQIHVIERARRVSPNDLQWTITLEDPVVFEHPWTVTRHYVRSAPDIEIREYVCAENNQLDKYIASPEDPFYQRPDARLKTLP